MAVGRRAHVQIALFVPPFLCFLRPFFSRNRISRLPARAESSISRMRAIHLFRLRINPRTPDARESFSPTIQVPIDASWEMNFYAGFWVYYISKYFYRDN